MRSLTKNKKGQFDFPMITFAIIVLGLIFLGPILLKMINSTLTPFENSLASIPGGNESGAVGSVEHIHGTFVNFWDGVLIVAFLLALILLFVSAFLIDTNPVFVILYILALFFTVVFAPNILDAINKVYDSPQFVTEVSNLAFMDFLRLNFGLIITVIGVLTMIIIYAKVRFFPTNN